jgi:integrase
VSLADARKKHQEAREQLAKGIDPSAAKQERRAALLAKETTFEDCFKVWLDHWKQGKEPRYVEQTLARINRNVIPAFGSKPVNEVTAADVREMMLAINERGARDIAKRAHETVAQVFRHAVVHGKAKRNPAADFKPNDVLPAVKVKNMARVDAKDVPALLAAVDSYSGSDIVRLAMKLLALTFVRTSELIEAEWSEFDLAKARWDIPAERMKMGTAHIVPLSKQALAVLAELKPLTGKGKLLFPGAWDSKKSISNNTLLVMLKRIGYHRIQTGHGWRGIASTVLHENGFEEAHIELQLAHQKRDRVAAAYNHSKYLPQRTELMQWWGNWLDQQRQKAGIEIAAAA